MRLKEARKNELKDFDNDDIVFYCPVKNCNYTSKMLSQVKMHFKKAHSDLLHFCPVCKRKVHVVHHCLNYIDDYHLVLYYLCRSSNQKTNVFYQLAEKTAHELLSKGWFKF